ncbi:hypothetical protein QNM97_10295 [Gordonia sp. L191]|uniref:hypothetical protein n=1 Tax=unclassified Gordonia (in: high G+C Gram-positive bacteria) TaxID=2657482 RepID=UPI0023E0FD60|nr:MULTISPECIES: hypothetical protein [unclassified Gordonia (in: high G+C Gram-positive bacteria)]MDF3283239.1 hypothetical protein [Gordonia sp. N1V]WHU49323.1 hypothetical protein QNM97_10295 [Gordonia sp. L191]
MARVEWTRQSGEDVEAVVAMLLCTEYPNAWRLRPGRGDGGVDVFVPLSDDRVLRDVYQVKKFASNLTNSQKRKIRASFEELLKTAEAEQWEISSWSLVLPLDPTPANEAWFDEMTADVDFPCRWVGLNRLDLFAAQNPMVIDYYLRDGKDRLQHQTDLLAGVIARRADRTPGEALQPMDVRSDLMTIYKAINAYDPHYRYELSMTESPPDRYEANRAGIVALASYGSPDGWLLISIFARSLAALEERPITGEYSVKIDEGSDLDTEYRRYHEFGTPVSLPRGTVNVRLSLPGGLGVIDSDDNVELSISPSETAREEHTETELVVAVLSPDESTLAELEVRLVEHTRGPAGGTRTVWEDPSEFVRLEILASEYPNLTVNMRMTTDPAGRRPADIVDSLEFIANLHDPNTLGVSTAYGPRQFSAMSTSASGRERDISVVRLAKVARALVTIQQHTTKRILFPSSYTGDQALEMIDVAKLLSGEAISFTWPEIRVDLEPDQDFPFQVGDEAMFRVVQALEISLDSGRLEVGKRMAILQGRVTELTATQLVAVPTGEDRAQMLRFDGDEQPGRVQTRELP